MAPPRGEAGNLCVWLISCIFFLLLVAGGSLLILYMVLPDSPTTAWFPAGGMILVGIPWVFWIATCFYRSMKPNPDMQVFKGAAVAPVAVTPTAAAARDKASPVNSPGGARNNNSAMATGDGGANGNELADEDSPAAAATSDAQHAKAGSSRASCESEAPLALSMS